jgi:hypothetical protein
VPACPPACLPALQFFSLFYLSSRLSGPLGLFYAFLPLNLASSPRWSVSLSGSLSRSPAGPLSQLSYICVPRSREDGIAVLRTAISLAQSNGRLERDPAVVALGTDSLAVTLIPLVAADVLLVLDGANT